MYKVNVSVSLINLHDSYIRTMSDFKFILNYYNTAISDHSNSLPGK